MSINVLIYKNKSENNRLDKDIGNAYLSVNCVFKTPTSIINPTLLIAYNEGQFSIFSQCNYIKIQSPINRYYFIDEVVVLANRLVEIRCHVDVLMTYKDAIRANKAIVQRQETNWNLYLNDGSFKIYQNPMTVTKVFPNGFPTPKYFLTVAGGLSS